jgi:O-antigen/teichoic acid export membrane protein
MTIPVQDHLTTDIEVQRSLTARAMLGGLSNALQFVIRLIVGLVITPFIIRGLGQELYGIWTMIQQTLGYVGLADLRVTNVVKFTLAVEQHKEDYHFKRQQVGASVLALAQVAPLILSAGVIIVCFAPEIVGSSAVYDNQVRWAVGIGIVGILMDSIFSVPGNILRGLY